MKTIAKTSLLLIVLAGVGTIVFLGCGVPMRYSGMDRSEMQVSRPAAMPGLTKAVVSESPRPEIHHNTETYDRIVDNSFRLVTDHPLSTFSTDVDTASYANIRRFLTHNQLPPPGAVRIEEMINYFTYAYDQPTSRSPHPFAVHAQAASCPWEPKHRLVRIALKGRELDPTKRPNSNLVFLLDVSGSMGSPNKLPLVKAAMKMLVEQLGEGDRVAIAVYAGASGLVLDSTSCDRKEAIISALDKLQSGGSTNGGAGIELAYNVAVSNFIKGGTNRVILATDGDFNIGTTNNSELIRLIEKKASSGVFLSVLGFGMGNYKDSRMEKLADKGNGNYAYIDSESEARKVLVREMCGTLVTIAKDVKIQVEFNPAQVVAYRLIGYENRMLNKEDFNDDKKDAGDIGAGHTVTALYQIVPAGVKVNVPSVDKLKYSSSTTSTAADSSGEMMTVKLRYKKPDGDKSTRMDIVVRDDGKSIDKTSKDFRFASSVASFGMLLRKSQYKGGYTLDAVAELAESAIGDDPEGYRKEFVKLVNTARKLRANEN
ncbi:MAG: VWA domain-containing protein [Phycisphaerae bacterium]|jgi:Ca-activated chloride channel family protein|nr:VWA domain-containing protein [Phycisphaerae bacterium]